MSPKRVTWLAGDATWQRSIENALPAALDTDLAGERAGERAAATRIHQSRHRTVHRLELPAIGDRAGAPAFVVLKIHHAGTGLRRARETVKRLLGRSPGRREWRALVTLARAGVAVPTPRAWGRLANGDEIVASDFLPQDRARDPSHEAPEESLVADAIADSIDGLHRAGFRHGDLHLGNLRFSRGTVGLLDVQRARPLRGQRDRLEDLARLELSLARAGWTPAARLRLRQRLEIGPEFDPILRRFLRDHLRGRARRVLRLGRSWTKVRIGRARGLSEASFDGRALSALFAAAQATDGPATSRSADASQATPPAPSRRQGRVRVTEIQNRERTFIVKCFESRGIRRALGDLLRGGPAARAFRRGQMHALLTNHAARPLAYLEEGRMGLPVRSWLVMEKVGLADLDDYRPASPEIARRVASALGEWLADLHAWGLAHRDLKGSNLRLALADGPTRFWLIDLEDLSPGPVELTRSDRLQALSQLNASLADEAFDLESRRAALSRYCARLPLSSDESGMHEIATEIARRSLARNHRWRGRGCDRDATRGIRPATP